MSFELPKLNYDFSALMPYIDTKTMQVHHGKHHRKYVDNFNKALKDAALEEEGMVTLLSRVSQYGDAIRNNGGGHYNHTLFWESLCPQGSNLPEGPLAAAISAHFGSLENFKIQFTKAAASQFGSGWAWLYVMDNQKLSICTTANQDSPLMDVVPKQHRGIPLLGLDVWEHAYYLHYQNRREEYINAFWHIVDWESVAQRYNQL